MPLIEAKLIERAFSDRQRQDIVRTLTDATVSRSSGRFADEPVAEIVQRGEPISPSA
jgi:hypothetical protein